MKTTAIQIPDKNIPDTNISKIDFENLGFGEIFSDHMFSAEYKNGEWIFPQIMPFGKLEILPSLCSLHYGQIVFEGLKAFRIEKKKNINIFRPERYHHRLNKSCQRLCIPKIDYEIFINGLEELIKLDNEWVPKKKGYSLYIRPFVFGTDNFLGVKISDSYRFMIITSPVGAYYKEGINPVKLMTSKYVRSIKGGLGETKTPANYAASLLPMQEAKNKGFSQILWLDGVKRKYIEESGAMNIFFVIDNELITPPLDGNILDGITRDCVIQIAQDWGIEVTERKISIDEIMSTSKMKMLEEAFGTGTAAVISPIGEIKHKNVSIVINDGKIGRLSQKFYDEITGIQYGDKEDKFGWCHMVDNG